MLPRDLKPEQFNGYPPEARKLVTGYIGALQRLPLSFLPSLLREAIDYDFKFPVERRAVEKELANLNSSDRGAKSKPGFRRSPKSSFHPSWKSFDWINSPAQFVEQLSSYLWTTHQLDAFRTAATEYANRLQDGGPGRAAFDTQAWELPLSARESRRTTKPCFASCARTVRISNGSSRKMVSSSC